MRMHQPASAKLATPFVALFLTFVACGQQTSPAATQTAAHFPMTITDPAGNSVTISHQPHRIVSLSPTATEMIFAVGAGAQVIAVDDQSNYPASAPITKLSGFEPNIEAIAGYTPDLLVAAQDLGGLVHGMQTLSVPILIEPAAKTIDDSYLQIKQLGLVTGHTEGADTLVTTMKSQVGAFVASIGKPSRAVRVYHELDNTYYSVTSATFIGQVYRLLGLTNIADAAAGSTPDYPQLSAEYIVSANPDLIVLADTKCCQQSLSTVSSRPGWGVISAVKARQVVNVDDDVASRWGPRVIDFMQEIAPHVQQLEKAA
jgi:iron complex transport system substrate-binding protein